MAVIISSDPSVKIEAVRLYQESKGEHDTKPVDPNLATLQDSASPFCPHSPLNSEAFVLRWAGPIAEEHAYRSRSLSHFYVIGIALRSTRAVLSIDGRRIHSGRVQAGTIIICQPGQTFSADPEQAYDFVMLYLKQDFMVSCLSEEDLAELSIDMSRHSLIRDADIATLVGAMMMTTLHFSTGTLYIRGLALAVVARVLALLKDEKSEVAAGGKLPAWRLKRVVSFIDKNLEKTISLDQLAASAGLSRNYFAAQFRAATGQRPREFVLGRRIQHAQFLLGNRDLSLVQVALDVGFQTQSHFTFVFKRLAGLPPHEWRERFTTYTRVARQKAQTPSSRVFMQK